MLVKITIGMLVGAAIGAALGSSRSCETGGCPLTATPQRGSMYGAMMGLLVAVMLSGPGLAQPREALSPLVAPVASVDGFDRDVVETEGKAVAYFSADWCYVCTRFAPVLNQVVSDKPEDVPFRKVDVDKLPALAKRYTIYALPTTIVFEGGEPVQRFEGMTSAGELRKALAS
jgi:thiol-disulfide isomerase/thioredoxin